LFTEGQQRPGSRFKQDREHHLLVVEHNGVERMRQGEDDMKVTGGQNLPFPLFQPPFAGHMLACGAVAIAA
jgi:hypothetical protein